MRLPFLKQAVAGDDLYFLYGAEHALVEPLHPLNAKYAFQGEIVDMRGHTHGPVDPWILALLLTVFGSFREVPFHAFFVLFSLIAGIAAWFIAVRFTDRPLVATLLFLAVPPFVVNGNTLEADVPFIAFWLLAIALYVYEHPMGAAVAAAVAALTSYQAVLLTPILFFAPVARRRWIPLLAAPAAVVVFQAFERLSGDALPAAMLTGYMWSHAWQSLHMKWLNAVALVGHLIVNIVFPAIWIDWKRIDKNRFLWLWAGIFFAGALVIFFAGAARYLLPMALPLCIVAAQSRLAWVALVLQLVLGTGRAVVNYEHWNAYPQIARDIPKARRVFVNGEWGIRHYLEELGATPFLTTQTLHAGDIVVSTGYAPKIDAQSVKVYEHEIDSAIPLRIVFLGGGSAFSSVGSGMIWPISFSREPLDRVRAEMIVEVKPTLEYVKIKTPEAASHIVSGINNADGWALEKGLIALKRPEGTAVLRASFYIPPAGAGREVELSIDGTRVAAKRYDEAGVFTLQSEPLDGKAGRVVVAISTDKPLRVEGDERALGVVLTEIGFARP